MTRLENAAHRAPPPAHVLSQNQDGEEQKDVPQPPPPPRRQSIPPPSKVMPDTPEDEVEEEVVSRPARRFSLRKVADDDEPPIPSRPAVVDEEDVKPTLPSSPPPLPTSTRPGRAVPPPQEEEDEEDMQEPESPPLLSTSSRPSRIVLLPSPATRDLDDADTPSSPSPLPTSSRPSRIAHPPPPTRAAPSLRPPPQEPESDYGGGQGTSDDSVKVEAEESEMEEVGYSDAQEDEAPPPIPTHEGRRASVQQHQHNLHHRLLEEDQVYQQTPMSEYVMVDEPESTEDLPPPRRRRRAAPTKGVPPPPACASMNEIVSWEMLEFSNTQADLSLSYDDLGPSSAVEESKPTPIPQSLNPDELMAIWGRVGAQICEVATQLHEKSKRAFIGDGTYHGFVQAALKEVPNASSVIPDAYDYLLYMQSGSSMQKRASDIPPGNVMWLKDAKMKGHKGIQTYSQTVGVGEEPVVDVVSEFEPKKFKAKVFQAGQHARQQTVESVIYRLEDLKSGVVKVYQVLEA
ncbi:sh3 domain-containing protein [Moniliophthora roreri MCA 2997]|uniref:Sh3 domain-containing protein n=2 Tax=Moniliophthora roreri TaxID=221103 RepID=V2X397_MONRO|nr:sh3 domain-containing protein [Moniliophthora roreri MCA 2997]